MPNITVEQETFERLQNHAQPLVDTVDAVVNRALNAMESGERKHFDEDPLRIEREVDPDRLPDLKHTKVLTARLGVNEVEKPNWNRLLQYVLIQTKGQVTDIHELRLLCPANMVCGMKTDNGYHYVPEVNISVQGMSANEACSALSVLARALGVELQIAFMWRVKDGAAHPGERGRLKLFYA